MAFGPKNLRFSFSGKNLTHFGGFFLVQHFFQRLNLKRVLRLSIRFKQRNNRYATSESILALLYPILVGLGRIDASGILKRNGVFRYLTGLKTYPDATTLRRFLLRFAQEGLKPFLRLHDALRVRMLSSTWKVIFDLDTTVLTVYGRQEGARVGYNPKKRGRPSYHPLLCFEGRTKDLWEASFQPRNVHPATISKDLLERAFQKLPASVREIRLRADSAFYDGEIIEYLRKNGVLYTIVARVTKTLKARLNSVRFTRASGEIFVGELRYQPSGWQHKERFIVVRRPVPEEPNWQLSLFQMKGYTYQVLVTALTLTPYKVWRFYNDRAQAELIIRELKEAYANRTLS